MTINVDEENSGRAEVNTSRSTRHMYGHGMCSVLLYMDSTYRETGPDVTDGPSGTVVDHRGLHRLHREDIFSFPDQSLLQTFIGKIKRWAPIEKIVEASRSGHGAVGSLSGTS